MARVILENGVTYVVHLATLLSAAGERNPALALKINTAGIQNILDLAAAHGFQVSFKILCTGNLCLYSHACIYVVG